jgi:hypothetical protein
MIYLWTLAFINTLGMQVSSEKAYCGRRRNLSDLEAAARRQDPDSDPELRRLCAKSYVVLGEDGPLVIKALPLLARNPVRLLAAPHPGPGH